MSYFTVNIGQSTDAGIQKDSLASANYGEQLGRIGDALFVLLRYLKSTVKLDDDEEKAVEHLRTCSTRLQTSKHANARLSCSALSGGLLMGR